MALCSGIPCIGRQPDRPTHASCSLAGLVLGLILRQSTRVSLDDKHAGNWPRQILYLAAWVESLVRRLSGLVWPVKESGLLHSLAASTVACLQVTVMTGLGLKCSTSPDIPTPRGLLSTATVSSWRKQGEPVSKKGRKGSARLVLVVLDQLRHRGPFIPWNHPSRGSLGF